MDNSATISDVREPDFSNERLEKMGDWLEERKPAIKEGIENFFKNVIAPDFEDANWSWLASANASTEVGKWQYHLDRCQQSFDKTKDKIATLSREDNQAEISINQMNKVIFASKAQALNIERAEYCLEVAKDWYKQILGKDWTKSSKGKLKSVETDGKSQKWIKDNLKQGILI